jgi:hypothetical protein
MKRLTIYLAVLCLLALSACEMDLSQPAAAPPVSEQNQAQSPTLPANQAPASQEVPAQDAQPGPEDQPTPDPLSHVTLSPSPTPEFPAEPNFQSLAPGQAVQFGRVVFTLIEVKFNDQQTVVSYQVQGLPDNYQPIPGLGEPALVTIDGLTVRASESGGGGGPGVEVVRLVFPSLPAGTQEFNLAIPNSWNGAASTWNIPVKINP